VSTARRVLLFGGMALAIWGMAYGLWYAVFAEHQALNGIGASLAAAFTGAAQANQDVVDSSLQQYKQAKYVYDRQVDVHSHWIGLAMLLIVMGFCIDHVSFGAKGKTLIAWGTSLGAVLFPLGVLLQTLSHGEGPRAVAIAGSIIEIACLFLFAFGILRRQPHSS
jgi:hypothetical protein